MKKVDTIKQKIIKEYVVDQEPETKLPSESMLAKKYSANRHTIRAALTEIKQRGLITSVVGSGWYVCKINPKLHNKVSSLMIGDNKNDFKFHYKVLKNEVVKADSFSSIFNCSEHRRLGHFERIQIREGDNKIIRYEETYFNRSLAPDLTLKDLEKSFGGVLRRNGHDFNLKESKIFSFPCTDYIADLLKLPKNSALLGVIDVSYDFDHTVAVYSFSVHVNSTVEIVYNQYN